MPKATLVIHAAPGHARLGQHHCEQKHRQRIRTSPWGLLQQSPTSSQHSTTRSPTTMCTDNSQRSTSTNHRDQIASIRMSSKSVQMYSQPYSRSSSPSHIPTAQSQQHGETPTLHQSTKKTSEPNLATSVGSRLSPSRLSRLNMDFDLKSIVD